MGKNILIGSLSVALVLFILLFVLKKGDVINQEKQIIVRDTIIIRDTIYLTGNKPAPDRIEKQNKAKETNQKAINDNPYKDSDLTYKIIPSENNTFGYDILISGRAMIHQPSVPGLPGNEGFKREERARKVAELVIKKIRNNEMPPSVSLSEMNDLNVLK